MEDVVFEVVGGEDEGVGDNRVGDEGGNGGAGGRVGEGKHIFRS